MAILCVCERETFWRNTEHQSKLHPERSWRCIRKCKTINLVINDWTHFFLFYLNVICNHRLSGGGLSETHCEVVASALKTTPPSCQLDWRVQTVDWRLSGQLMCFALVQFISTFSWLVFWVCLSRLQFASKFHLVLKLDWCLSRKLLNLPSNVLHELNLFIIFVKCETNLQVSELSCLICQEQQPTCHRVMMHLENYVTLCSDSTSKQEVTNLLYLYKKIWGYI